MLTEVILRKDFGNQFIVFDKYFHILYVIPFFVPPDAGAAVYLYEYQHPPIFLQKKRPSFVRSDHGDEIFTVFGFCFTTTHIKLARKCDFHKPTDTHTGNKQITQKNCS